MDRYDPSQPPNPTEWLELDERERAILVEEHHRHARIDLPNATVHAIVHVVVENQLATNDDPVVRALARLMKAGLPRHDAIHALGSVVSEHIFDLLKRGAESTNTAESARARYYAAIERITAAKWLEDDDG